MAEQNAHILKQLAGAKQSTKKAAGPSLDSVPGV